MAKNKIQKKNIKRTGTSIAETKQTLPTAKKVETSSLIAFHNKTKWFLLGLLIIYFLMSILKIHTSSVGMWDQIFRKEPESIISGQPRPIRQDEWMVSTPALVGQYQIGMPVSNRSMGDGNVPVIFGSPIKDLSMILRPSLWPYFIFDVERGFAFSWNFNIFFFLISSFLLFMLLTKNNFWLSVFGVAFIFLSSAVQWWSYSLASQMIWLNGIIISFIYLLYSRNRIALIIAGVVFLFSGYNFIVGLYPPWQVPLFYLYLAILIGYVLSRKDFARVKEKLATRSMIFGASIIVLGIFLFHYYGLVKNTYDIMMNTAYPGKRITNGGDLVSGKLFSEFLGNYVSDVNYPKEWWNISEISSFWMFFPVLFYCIGYNYFRYKKFDWLQIFISLSILFFLVWILMGFPSFLSKLTFLSMSPVYRTLPVLGLANCILLICYLSNKDTNKNLKFSWMEFALLAIAIFIFAKVTTSHMATATGDFFKTDQLITASLIVTVVYLLTRYSYIKFVLPALCIVLLGLNISNATIHPLTKGLSPLLENPLVQATKPIKENDPNARWAVFGDPFAAYLLRVNGIDVFNGVKSVPILKDMAVLDSSGKNNFIYNRYAHINLATYIDWKDSVGFKLNENPVVNDNYTISMDPCSPKLKKLGVNYFLFSYKPQDAEIRCMTPVKDTFGMYIYKRKDI